MTSFTIEGKNLVIRFTGTDEEREDARVDAAVWGSDTVLTNLTERVLCNSDWEYIAAEEIGALTDSPIFGCGFIRDEDGNATSRGRVFWFPDYQVTDPVEVLLRTGKVTFTEGD